MSIDLGYPTVVIPEGPISDEHRIKFNSFKTRGAYVPQLGGRFLVAVSCAHSNAEEEDCIFTRGIFRDTATAASSDANQLMHDLRAHGEE